MRADLNNAGDRVTVVEVRPKPFDLKPFLLAQESVFAFKKGTETRNLIEPSRTVPKERLTFARNCTDILLARLANDRSRSAFEPHR
jgi:hypothetical protein